MYPEDSLKSPNIRRYLQKISKKLKKVFEKVINNFLMVGYICDQFLFEIFLEIP